jgi:heme/copper-type cytochrome/quinol oxidase subunit 3
MASNLLQQKSKMLILSVIATESIFFAFLITAFVFYHGGSRNGPNPSRSLDPLKTGMFSIALWASSGAVWMSERAMRQRQFDHMKRWLEATIFLGAIFLFGQGSEYYGLIKNGVLPRTDTFATTFFTATGFHGIHVVIGLIVLLILRGLASDGFGRESHQQEGYQAAAYYWHFVDAVWVAIFVIIYIWGTR